MGPTESEAALHRSVGRLRGGFLRHHSKREHTPRALFCTWFRETKPCTVCATRYEVVTLKVITFVDSNAELVLSNN